MTKNEMKGLGPGDLVRHRHAGEAYVVHRHLGHAVIAVRTVYLSNPSEWDRVTAGGSVKREQEA